MGKFKIGDKVRCVSNGTVIHPNAMGYKPDREFVVYSVRGDTDGDLYFGKHDHGVHECDLILVKNENLIGRKVKGFRFNHEVIHYGNHMDKYVDQEGIIVSYGSYGPGYMVMFDTYSIYTYPAELIEKYLIEVEETMKKYTITREQLQEIYDVACSEWKETILKYSRRNPFGNTIEFIQEEVDTMFKAATLDQTPVLENIFGKQTREIDLSGGTVDGLELFIRGERSTITNALMCVRLFGEYRNKAFILNAEYNWDLVNDTSGNLCLVPTRK